MSSVDLVKRRAVQAMSTPACWSWPIAHRDFHAAARARSCRDAYNVLADWQHGLCAICGEIATNESLDHDHRNRLVRGLLCGSCNIREGHPSRHTYAVVANYRHIPPAMLLDMRIKYVGNYMLRRT